MQRFAFPILIARERKELSFAETPKEIHVIPVGKWDHPAYGEMEITDEDIAEFEQNFKDGIRRDLPITLGHDNGMSGGELPAAAWFKNVYARAGKGLYAEIEWTEKGIEAIKKGEYKYFSPEFYTKYEDPETRRVYNNVLVGGALTNKPYFKELDPVASFSEPKIINQFNLNENMDLQTILAKKVEELTAEEKAFVIEHKAELTAEQTEAFKSVLGETETAEQKADREKAEADAKAKADADAAAAAQAEADRVAAEKQASEKNKGKMVTMSEAEANILRANADKGAQAFAELEKMRVAAEVSKLVFSESNKDGRFAPRQKDTLEKFFSSLNDSQRKIFGEIVSAMPKLSFGEIGDGGNTETNIVKDVESKVHAKIKASEGKLTFSTALVAVFKENPDLEKQYNDSLSEE